MKNSLRGAFVAALILWPVQGLPQVFQPQGPGPSAGDGTVQSFDAPPGGTVAGSVQSIVQDPGDANTLYIGAPNGGIWVTRNGGTTWTPLSDSQASTSISSLALDPTDATRRTLIAGTGFTSNGTTCPLSFCFFSGSGTQQNGLLYSTNGGATFTSLGAATLAGQTVVDVAARGSVILAATYESSGLAGAGRRFTGGLYRSADRGATFTLVSGGSGLPAGPVTSMVADPSNPNRFYAAVTATSNANFASSAVYFSTDAGATWAQDFSPALSGGTINAGNQTSIKLAAGPNGSVAIGIVNTATGRLTGLFYSSTAGANWIALPIPPANNLNPGGQGNQNFGIAIDPNNPRFVYISGDRIQNPPYSVTAFRIDATAQTITSITDANTGNASSVHADSRNLIIDSRGRLLMVGDGGVYARTNPQVDAGAWIGLNGNLSVFQPAGLAYDANSKRLVVSAQDTGAALQNAPGGSVYTALQGGDGIIAQVNDKTLINQGRSAIYTSSQNLGNLSRLVVDRNGVAVNTNLNIAGAPIVFNTPIVGLAFSSPFVLNNIDPSRIAVGGSRVYVTQDTLTGANSPDAFNVNLTLTDVGDAGGIVSKIAYGTRDNPNVLVAGSIGNLFISTTATANSLVALPAYQASGGAPPTSVVLDPRSQNRFYTADGFSVFGTSDQGANFQNLSGNLPGYFFKPTAVEFISANGVNVLLVGGANTIANAASPVYSADSSATGDLSNWRAFGQGLPNTVISHLVYNEAVDVLAVGTYGRGAFVLYDVTSYFPQATTLRFGLANNDSAPDASFLSGDRPLVKFGTGTLTISGAATYTGGTTINAGTLQLGNGGAAGSITGNVVNNGTLAFNRSDTLTFDGVISGTGQVQHNGAGRTILTAASTYTGMTTINAGTLSVNGSLASSVTVNAGGILGGNGRVGATTVNPGGIVAPGNSVGTLTVQGNLTLNPGGTVVFQVQDGKADKLTVNGNAQLGGNAVIEFDGGRVAHRNQLVSVSGTETGAFASVTNIAEPDFLDERLVSSSSGLQLVFDLDLPLIPNLNRNQLRVANVLDAVFNDGGDLGRNFDVLFGKTDAQIAQLLTSLTGETATAAQEVTLRAGGAFLGAMADQATRPVQTGELESVPASLNYAGEKPKAPAQAAIARAAPPTLAAPGGWSLWTQVSTGGGRLNGNAIDGSSNVDYRSTAVTGGIDKALAADLRIGAAISGSAQYAGLAFPLGKVEADTFHAGLYATKFWNEFYLSGQAFYGRHEFTSQRTITGLAQQEQLRGSFGGNSFGGRAEAGWRMSFASYAVTPFAALQGASLRTNGFNERSSLGVVGTGLAFGARTANSAISQLGAKFEAQFSATSQMSLTGFARLAWAHEFDRSRQINASFLAFPGASFTVTGAKPPSDAALVSSGIELKMRNGLSAFGKFDSAFSGKSSNAYAGTGGLRFVW